MDKRRSRFETTKMSSDQMERRHHPYINFKRVHKAHSFTKQETERSSKQLRNPGSKRPDQDPMPYRPDPKQQHMYIGPDSKWETHFLGMVVMDLQTPSLIEEKGFQRFMRVLHPSIDAALSASAIRKELVEIYHSTRKSVKKALLNAKDPVLSAELWSSSKEESYLTVTCHFIDEKWEMKSYILDTAQLLDEVTQENVHQQLGRISTEWDILEKIQVVVVNYGMKKAQQKPKWTYIPCFSHTLNKVIQEALDKTNLDWGYLLKKCRRIVQFFHHQHEALWGHQLAQSTCLDWLSTLNMLTKICEHWPSFSPDSNYSLTSPLWLNENERKLLENMVQVLTVIKDVTCSIGTCGYVSVSNIIPMIDNLQSSVKKLIQQDNKVAARISEKCSYHFGSIKQNFWFTLSTALDPRFKSSIPNDDEGEKVRTKIIDEMSKRPSGARSDQGSFLQYASDKNISVWENPLQYWAAKNKSKNLAMVAHKYLSVISTAIPVEQMMHKDRSQMISSRRKCLEPEDVNMMLFLNGNYQKI